MQASFKAIRTNKSELCDLNRANKTANDLLLGSCGACAGGASVGLLHSADNAHVAAAASGANQVYFVVLPSGACARQKKKFRWLERCIWWRARGNVMRACMCA